VSVTELAVYTLILRYMRRAVNLVHWLKESPQISRIKRRLSLTLLFCRRRGIMSAAPGRMVFCEKFFRKPVW